MQPIYWKIQTSAKIAETFPLFPRAAGHLRMVASMACVAAGFLLRDVEIMGIATVD